MEFDQYIIQGEPGRRERAEAWQVAIGLQAVDGLKPSRYLIETAQEHIENRISIDEVDRRIVAYYQTEQGRKEEAGTDEADGVSARITRLLAEQTFSFSPAMLASIHRRLFDDILLRAGRYRVRNISKREWVLDNASVLYSSADMIAATLDYDFEREKEFSYRGLELSQVVKHVSSFVSGIWQIHPFMEGNTRTTAIFTIKYLNNLGFKVNNDPFKEHSWYFRNALVRANYQNIPAGVERTTEFLELFFRNLLMGEQNELKNRYCHIRWTGERPHVPEDGSMKSSEESSEEMWSGSVKSSVKIMALMKKYPFITAELIAEKIGISSRAVEKQMAKLKSEGKIVRLGSTKGGHWEVVK